MTVSRSTQDSQFISLIGGAAAAWLLAARAAPGDASSRSIRTSLGRRCCAVTTLRIFCFRSEDRARIQPETESTLGFAHRLVRRHCMGETLLLLSCGAAFITGLAIAAASLFG
jgi:hypothetical protein